MEIETTVSYTHPEEDDEPNNDNNTNQEHVALNQIRASNDEHPIMGEKISAQTTDNLKEEEDPDASDDLYDDDQSEEDEDEDDEEEEEEVEVELENLQQQRQQGEERKSPKPTIASDDEDEDDDTNANPRKKQKSLASLNTIENPETAPPVQFPTTTTTTTTAPAAAAAVPETTAATAGETVTVAEVSVATAAAAVAVSTATAAVKKPKKKNNNVWTKSTRKGKKKTKSNNHNGTATEDTVLITPIPRFPDRSDDSTDAKICLSKVYKAEKVELSEDRLSAGSSKGYRMVRATRGIVEGAWYFEIKVLKLGETGHTRLGWSMEKGDLQAPVGYDGNSFGYRDIDGSKVHKAVREKYGEEGYVEGDVIGCYINLPDGSGYAPKPPHFVWYKGQRYMCAADGKEESPKVVPGSEISFFKNGVCQGVAFKDLFGGRYYPAASMYTLPNQPNCVVTFNFGPDFEFFPQDFDGRPIPRPMIEVPYHGFDNRVENSESNEKKQ